MDQRSLICRRDVWRIIERAVGAVKISPLGELPDGHIPDHVVHRDHVENLRHVGWIGSDDPGRVLDIYVTNPLHQGREHDQPGHDRPIRGIVEPAVVVGVVVYARVAEFVEQI